MPDARYRPPAAPADPERLDSPASRAWLLALALLLVPGLAWCWDEMAIQLHWYAYEYVLKPLILPGKTQVWHNAAVFVLAYGVIDLAAALIAFRPLAWVYGRWAPVVAAVIVLPYAMSRYSHAMRFDTPALAVSGWLELATAALPLVWLTWRRQRRLAGATARR